MYLSCEIECYRQYSSSRLLLQGSLGAGRTPCSSPHTDCPLDTGTALHTLKHTQAEDSCLKPKETLTQVQHLEQQTQAISCAFSFKC